MTLIGTTLNTRTKTITDNNKFYCSQKFWWLSVDIEKFQTLSCCAATPQKIKLDWLKSNSGHLFNTPDLCNERTMMLNNQQVASCSATCWSAEKQDLPSRRLTMNSDVVTHTSITSSPEVLHILVGSHCNMTCVYCCKQYSSAWLRDVHDVGTYNVTTNDDRFVINTTDKILRQLSQKEIGASETSKALLHEIQYISNKQTLREIEISGGEPFLYNGLATLIDVLPNDVTIKVWTGLGVDESRFKRELAKIALKKNVAIVISAENIGEKYEFVRYGNTWDRFKNNINTLDSMNIEYEFNATVSNLTVFGLNEFSEYFNNKKINYQPVTDPDFLSISVLDSDSKELVRKTAQHWFIAQALDTEATDSQYINLQQYLKEFAQRRHLSLNVFPQSFVHWINNG